MTDSIERLHVGDHVTDRQDPDARMVVVGTPVETAAEYAVSDTETVADYNDCPDDDRVLEVAFPTPTHTDIDRAKRYAYPRSRLEAVTTLHEDTNE